MFNAIWWEYRECKDISCFFALRNRWIFDISYFSGDLYTSERRILFIDRRLRAHRGEGLFYYLPADWYQAIVIFHSLDVPSIRLHPLALFEIDIDDPNSRFRRRYLPVVMYVREHNTRHCWQRKRNSICRFCFIPSLFYTFGADFVHHIRLHSFRNNSTWINYPAKTFERIRGWCFFIIRNNIIFYSK